MIKPDPPIQVVLDHLLPPLPEEKSDWQRVLHEAQVPQRERPTIATTRRRRRWTLGFATAMAVGTLAVVPALAIQNSWWFLGEGTPEPVADVSVITAGEASGSAWYLVAFVSADKGVCVGVTGAPDEGYGAMTCGASIRGLTSTGDTAESEHWISYASGGLPTGAAFVFGRTATEVERVDVALSNGDVVSTDTIPGTTESEIPGRFYVTQVPSDAMVEALAARNGLGELLERLSVPARAGRSRSGG